MVLTLIVVMMGVKWKRVTAPGCGAVGRGSTFMAVAVAPTGSGASLVPVTTTSGFVSVLRPPSVDLLITAAQNTGTLVRCPLEGVRGSLPRRFLVQRV